MKAMILGFVAIAVIAVAANFILEGAGWSAEERGASSGSVRLDD
ncbi:hypothetical protein [Marivita sp. GX14005]|nr:hypothetical protein [Marivita sp. GX14005]